MKNIYIIEDEPEIADILKTCVSMRNHNPVHFINYDAAIKNLDGADLVLADFNVPGKTQVSQYISMLREKHPKTPVVLVSACLNLPKIAKEAGANEWIQKPFDLNSLFNVIDRLAPKQ